MNEYYASCPFPKPQKEKKGRPRVSQETYDKVYEACLGQCVLCYKTKGLELHHVLGRGKDLTDNYRYCVMLCDDCHDNVVHHNLKKYRPILLKICEELYGKP